MHVAVTGATGHIGTNVVRELLAHGLKVRSLCRPNSNMNSVDGLDVETVIADVLEPNSLQTAFRGVDAVVHLAAIISITGDPDGMLMRTNVEGARNVAAACLDTGVSKLVHMSSIHAVKSPPNFERFDETTPPADRTCFAYDRSKAEGEREILAAVARGLDATILNPTGVLGPYDHANSLGGQMLRRLFQGRLPALVDAGFDWVDVRDVAHAVRTAIFKGRRAENYLISGAWASFKELSENCAAVSGVLAPKLVLPLWIASLSLPLLRLQSALTGAQPLYTYESLRILRDSNKNCVSEKACRELAHDPRPLQDTIRDTYAWYRETSLV